MAENDIQQPTSKRMEVLQRSLEKKQAKFDRQLQNHVDDVRGANGQPLNDKRNGRATLNRWEKQNDALRTTEKEIEKTQRAIEREQAAIDRVNNADIPDFLKPMIESGEISQWRKYPNRFFVNGVDKARIIWHADKQEFGYAYINGLPEEQFIKFRDTYNHIRDLHRQERENTHRQEKAAPETAVSNAESGKSAQPAVAKPSEKHYSEQIIDCLAANHEWVKQDAFTASRSFIGTAEGGSLNPDGKATMYARFDRSGRYLALERGWDTVFDIDARDARPETAAAVFNLFTERSAGNIPFVPKDVTEMLDTAKSENWIEDRLAENGYSYVSATPGFWEKGVGRYGIKVSFSENEALVTQTDRQRGASETFRIPVRESDTVMTVVEQREQAAREKDTVPPPSPAPEERLQTARRRYLMQDVSLTQSERQQRQYKEYLMEKAVRDLSPELQVQARANFYESQVSETVKEQAAALDDPRFDLER